MAMIELRSAWLFALALGTSGCNGCGGDSTHAASVGESTAATEGDTSASSSSGGSDEGAQSDPELSECRQPSYPVYLALATTCEGCHGEGTNFPAFSSFEAFERLILGDATLVVPGDAEASDLLALLAGTAAPPLRQMPPGANSFADLADEGLTDIDMEGVRTWIDALEPCDVPTGGGTPRFARRVDAEHVRAMLHAQLELELADVLHVTHFPIDDPTFGPLTAGDNSERAANARWAALGGPNLLAGNQRNGAWSPVFVQTLGPMAQAWCRRSIGLGRDALLRHADATSDSTQDAAAIRDNIRYLYLRLLGIDATDDDVEAMYAGVYLPYESAEDATTAWTAVCAAMIRDPLWSSL